MRSKTFLISHNEQLTQKNLNGVRPNTPDSKTNSPGQNMNVDDNSSIFRFCQFLFFKSTIEKLRSYSSPYSSPFPNLPYPTGHFYTEVKNNFTKPNSYLFRFSDPHEKLVAFETLSKLAITTST